MPYAVVQEGYAIFGTGQTPDDAWTDARWNVDKGEDGKPNVSGLVAYPCTDALVDLVAREGGAVAWDQRDGVLDIVRDDD